MDLPRFIAFNSMQNFKHLRYVKEDGDLDGYLQYSSDGIVSPYTKFEVEQAKGRGSTYAGLFHIRCSYNNKYLVRKSADNNFILAAANEREEDVSKWSCTLFEPIYDKHFESYRFRHVQLDFYLSLWKTFDEFHNCLSANNPDPVRDHSDLATITDWQSLCIMPKFVSFKQGSSYLKCNKNDGNYYLQFEDMEEMDEYSGHEVFIMDDGTVHIKNTFFDYWRRDRDWIKGDEKDTTGHDSDILFRPVLIPGKQNVVALQNLGNHRYCRNRTADGKENCLCADAESITSEAKMEVNDYVSKREIYNVQFDMAHARIYGKKPQTMASSAAVNNANEDSKMTLGISYDKSSTSTWETTLGMTLGVRVELVAEVPLIAEAHFETNVEFSGSYSWGESHTITEHVEEKIEVTIPPKSERRVNMVAKRGRCNIPFSYTQRDVLPNGKVVITQKNDGIYKALNYFDFEQTIDDPRSL